MTPPNLCYIRFYDIPGSTWGTSTLSFRTNLPMTRIDRYWESVRSNVKAAYEHGYLTDEQWALYEEIYQDKENKMDLLTYNLPDIHQEYLGALKQDLKVETKKQVLDFRLPFRSEWELK